MPSRQPSVKAGKPTLADAYPVVAARWHSTKNNSLTPHEVTPGSKVVAWWVCEQGHEFDDKVSSQVAKNGRCPVCTNRRILAGFNDLGTVAPDIAELWHPSKNEALTPQMVGKGTKKKVWWLCEKEHSTFASIPNKISTKGSCPVCTGKQCLAGFNDIATTHPEIAAEWHGEKNKELTPQQVTAGSNEKVWWKCRDCAQEWDALVCNRTRSRTKATGCPYCAGQKVKQGLNDLATTHPELAAQWHSAKNAPLLPQAARSGSNANVWWVCERGHEWKARVSDRVRGYGCKQCYLQELPSGSVSLAEGRPDLVEQWDAEANLPFTPNTVAMSSSRIVGWVCDENPEHKWIASVANRTTKNSNCPACWAAASTSKLETELYDAIVAMGFTEAQQHVTTILEGRAELDIYLPGEQVGIEFNGGYWHSEAAGKTKLYHLNKWEKCQEKGIHLIQVWEDDWLARKDIVLRGLAHKLNVTHRLPDILPELPKHYTERIGARKTKVVDLAFKDASSFLDEHHIQGSVSGTHYYGLQDSQERLRAVIVLTKTGVPGEWLISRYASAGVVSGGFTKLLKHAEKQIAPDRWVTFADLEISDGGLYENNGFVKDKVLPPDYSYLVGKERVHKFNYRIERFRNDDSLRFEEGLTEAELAELNGLPRVWDTGKVRYVKNVLG